MTFQGHIIIIGAMKAATTTLHFLLAQHPHIARATKRGFRSKKELDFFLDDRDFDYLDLFGSLRNGGFAYTLEASPSYTKGDETLAAAQRIARLGAKKRLIYILRDPLDRIESHIAHNVAKGRRRWATPGPSESRRLIGASSYAKQMEAFEKAGLANDILILDFDEVCTAPLSTIDRVHRFLGVERIAPENIKAKNVNAMKQLILSDDLRDRYREELRPDVERLAERYSFEPARRWLEN